MSQKYSNRDNRKPEYSKPEYSVVVPVYNSEGSLRELYRRLSLVFHSLNVSWELIAVNDCSRDRSWKVLLEMAEAHQNVKAINLMNNFGQHNALMCGFHHVQGKYVITMDDDLQHPPEEIPKLISRIESGNYGVVYGQYKQKRHGWFRDFVSASVNDLISRITGSGYRVTSFRIMERKVVEKILAYTQYNVMIDVLIKDTVASLDVGHCRVEHHPRTIGKSNYSFKKLFWYAVNMVFNYTVWPLRLATLLGFFFSVLGFMGVILEIILYLLQGTPVRGWTSLFLAVTFFSGIILFILGIVGEYMGRIFLNVNQKPQYVVKELVTKNNNKPSVSKR